MRAFTTLFIAAALTVSTSAIEAGRPQGFSECTEVTKKMSAGFPSLTNLLISYQGPSADAKQKRDGEAALLTATESQIFEQYGEFFNLLDSATLKCCSGVPNADEVKDILDAMSNLVPDISYAMDNLKLKKPQLSGISLLFAEHVLEEVDSPTKKLQKCLVDAAPKANKAKGQEYADSVLKALKDAQDLYKINVPSSTPAPAAAGPTVSPADAAAPNVGPTPAPAGPTA